MARSRIPEMNWASENHEEALQLFKQTVSYYCENEDITDPGKIALKILRGIGNESLKRLNASGMSDEDQKRPDKNMGVVWVSAKDKSQLQSASSPLDGLQAKKWGICQWLCNQSTLSSLQVWIWREWIGGKDHWTHDCIHTNRSIPAWTAGKSQRLQADRRTCRGETFWSHSRRSTWNSETHKHTTEQCGPSRPSMWQLWQSPSPKSMSGIQRCVQILLKKIGRWKKFCWKCKGTVQKKMFNNVVTPNRVANNIGMLAKAAVGESEDSMIWSQQPVTLQRKTPLNPMTAYAYPVYATRFSQHWMLSVLGKRAYTRSDSRSILELRGTHSPLGHTSRCTRHSPQKTSLSPQGTSSWLPTMVRRSPV